MNVFVTKAIIMYIAILKGNARAYTCVGGTEIANGNGGENHLNTWGQGGHTGKVAPCAINKTYTAYEDHPLGDGGRGSSSANSITDYPLFGGKTGLQCLNTGQCTGKDQDAPVQLLGTDSYGCCCSPGPVGLGLNIGEYAYSSAPSVLRYLECDTTLVKNSVQQAPCSGIEVCQFEITRLPTRGTIFSITPSGGKGDVIGNCSEDSPCIIPPYFNAFQPVNYNLVGSPGRFDTSKFIFQPYPGDVGECDANNNDCFGLGANEYYLQAGQNLWQYANVEFTVRTFTWKYLTDDGLQKEFSRTGQNRYVEVIEDAFKKSHYMNVSDLFFVEGCPCSYPTAGSTRFLCSTQQIVSTCSNAIANAGGSGVNGGTMGRIMIIDLQRMRAVDGGLAVSCSFGQQQKCYTNTLISAMIKEVKDGCGLAKPNAADQNCFAALACSNECTGQSYAIIRTQTGISEQANQTIRIVPYNDRITIGGAGNSLRFDGIDDLLAATVDVFPQKSFTIMFWLRGLDPTRTKQALLQFISQEAGIELQLFNPENLVIKIHGYSSGPTGIDVNSDLLWHHIAITWSSTQGYLSDNSFYPAGSVHIYVDCNMTLDLANPRVSQSTQFGGQASYICAGGKASWTGILAGGEKFSNIGEISFGQRLACNATTRAKGEELQREFLLNQSSTFCRRKARPQCDPAFNQTASIFIPGIYSPPKDCINTTSGIFLTGDNCVFNLSDPFSSVSLDTVHLQMAMDWMASNDVKPATGMDGSIYTIPVVKEPQIHQREQCNCVSGCFDSAFSYLGHIGRRVSLSCLILFFISLIPFVSDDFRVYNYSLSSREIAFLNGEGVRDGVNCDTSTVFIKIGYQEQRCSHMIDNIYKYGLTLYWPFDDPVDLYGVDSSILRGDSNLLPTFPMSFDVAQVQLNALGNTGSSFQYAARLGGGLPSAAPMFTPSTAPVRGARYDFVQYARGTYQAIRLAVRDVDTCTNAADPFDITSDSFLPAYCDGISCPDSLCDLLRIVMSSTGYGMGAVYQAQVRTDCQHPYTDGMCAPFPECQGLFCFEHSSLTQQIDQPVNRLLAYTGAWVYEGTDQQRFDAGRQGVTFCDSDSCSWTTFSMSQKASNIPSGRTGSYTYQSVKLQQGSITEYRNIICHGGGRCDSRTQSPNPGWVLTLDRPLSFIPISGRTQYWIYKGKYEPMWLVYYFSDALGGGGIATDLLAYDGYDGPGEAGTQLNSNIGSPQYLDTVPDPIPPDWNEPVRRTNLIVTPLNAPLAFPYNVTISKGFSPAVIAVDMVLDTDSSYLGFNLTVNGPQEIAFADSGLDGKAGNSGDMFQAIEMHCGLIPQKANCSIIPPEQILNPNQPKQTMNVTWCDDQSYVKSDSLIQTLMNLHPYFRFGIISKLCTYNRNKTEIYNITAYNFSCLPPCVGTLYTFQEIAPGCTRNCSQQGLDQGASCENTYGLYPDEYACVGGVYDGQPCMGLDDQGSCFDASAPTQAGVCVNRDSVPGISGPNLKSLPGFQRTDPGLMVHGVHFGDVQFVDWLHRGASVVWNEVAVDVAAGLGYFEIVKYLIQNGCPWRDTAIQAAKMRGRPLIASFLEGLKPPLGIQDPFCGCARFFLHPVNPVIARCFPFTDLECYQTCSSDPDTDISCINGLSNYLGDNDTTAVSIKESGNAKFLMSNDAPATSRCSTGSKTALVRGPKIYFIGNVTNNPFRAWTGTNIGFASSVDICVKTIPGIPPIEICVNRTLVQSGQYLEFWNYHISDPRGRVLYFPPHNALPGRLSSFSFTISRMSQSPTQDHTGLDAKKRVLFSTPIAARDGIVEIHVESINYRPQLKGNSTIYTLKEDQIAILTLQFNDIDTLPRNIRAYITEFPKHGDLHQVVSSSRILNGTFSSESAYGFGQELNCKTSNPDCTTTGDCMDPIASCYFVREDFLVGEAITQRETVVTQLPIAIFNTSTAFIYPVKSNKSDNVCWETDRYAEDGWWGGEVFCELTDLDNVPGDCRRCMIPSLTESKIPSGHWSGRLVINPVYLQRHDFTKALSAPNDLEQGGQCSLDEQCEIQGNTASKSACIEWDTLDINGQPTVNVHNLYAKLNPLAPGYPCKGKSDHSQCSRDLLYLWPPGYSPNNPIAEERILTDYGDPIDTDSFYSRCGRVGVHQFRAQYTDQVFMQGFDLFSDMPDSILLRVLAKTGRRHFETLFSVREVTNSTRETRQAGGATITSTFYSSTKRKERNQTTVYCGGDEWREVWRGFAADGRNASGWSLDVLRGRSLDDHHMMFRFAPLNFTTSDLKLEACGLMYDGPTNNDGGNPLESLEGLVLVGTKHTPIGLVTDQFFRLAYIPHPHFVGEDSFSVRGEDFQNVCHGIECQVRANLQESRVGLFVENVNDVPMAPMLEITGDSEQPIVFTLDGIDASPDTTVGWTEYGILGQGAGAGSRDGVGPASLHNYILGQADPLGSPDQEPDSALSVTITQFPDIGTLVSQGGRTFKYIPAAGTGGRPCTTILFTLSDPHGLTSLQASVVINIICDAGFIIDQSIRQCVPCAKGFFKPMKDDRTACTMCDPGYYASDFNSTTCSACAAGLYAAAAAAAECKYCRPGTYSSDSGMHVCPACPAGKFSPRPSATACLDCGPLSYNPLAGMPRCYDCPYMSRSSVLNSNNVSNCLCLHNSYRQAIFDANVSQRWSNTGFGTSNGSFVGPHVPAIEQPWPLRLRQISSNCTPCPEGGFCFGENVLPVSKIGFWTDTTSASKEFWPNFITPQYYLCNSRNIRSVCMGYPMFYPQEQEEICLYRKNYGTCDSWPYFNYTMSPDIARCKAGYEGVICSQCIPHELKQCVPTSSDTEDGWFSWGSFAEYRAKVAFAGRYVPNCYAVGGCDGGTNSSTCAERETSCRALNGICRWDVKTYYRNFAGSCLECPLPIGPGFIIYVAWFAIYGIAIAILVLLYLSDMKSFCISINFLQCVALVARFRLPWPPFALSVLSACSLANVNLEALPWKCFFGLAPSYSDLWFLTIFVPAALMSGTIVWWLFPFLVVPPRGKIALKAFKNIMSRRDNLRSAGSSSRTQYMTPRSDSQKSEFRSKILPDNMKSEKESIGSSDSETYDQTKNHRGLGVDDSWPVNDSGNPAQRTEEEGNKKVELPSVAWDEIHTPVSPDSQDRSGRRSASRKTDDISLEDIGVEAAMVAGTKFGASSEDPKEASPSPMQWPRANASLSSVEEKLSQRKLSHPLRCSETSMAESEGLEYVLPGAALGNVVLFHARSQQSVSGEAFGSYFEGASKFISDSVRASTRKALFNRGQSAIGVLENRDQTMANLAKSSESEQLIHPDPNNGDELSKDSVDIPTSIPDLQAVRSKNESSLENAASQSASHLEEQEAPLTPSKRRRQEEGYREWSTQNITQSFTPRMEQRQDTARSTASSDEVYKPIGLPWYARRQYLDLAWRNCVGILDMMFIMSSSKSLEVFQWRYWTDSTTVLDADPNTRAFSPIHKGLISFAIIVFPFYVASPIINNAFIAFGWWKRQMDDQSFAMKWGFLLDSFERKYWFWNIFVSIRRFCFVIAAVFLGAAQYVQCFLPVLILTMNVIANYNYRPYREERHNALENILLIGLIVVVLVGNFSAQNISLYHDSSGRNLLGPYDDAMTFCVISVLGIGLVSSARCMYEDMMVAQVRMPALIRYAYRILTLPFVVIGGLRRETMKLVRFLSAPPSNRGRASTKPTKTSKFRNSTAFNRDACGDPPELTGTRLIDIFWEGVKKMRRKKEQSVLQDFDDHGVLVRPDDGATWLQDKFSMRKRVFLLEKELKIESTFDPRSAAILRTERHISTVLDAVIEYQRREKDEFFAQLYDAQTEHELLSMDHKVAQSKVSREEGILNDVVRKSNYSRVKLDTEVRRVGQPEEWKRRFLSEQARIRMCCIFFPFRLTPSEQAIRQSLEQEIVDLQAQIDKIRLQEGGN